MAHRSRSFSAWLRIVHRWVAMTFVVAAALVILQVVPAGPAVDLITTAAVVLLIALILTGIWMAAHHYLIKLRYRRRPARAPVSTSIQS
ncbi:hypothetical protein [Agromyces bauzanensis]